MDLPLRQRSTMLLSEVEALRYESERRRAELYWNVCRLVRSRQRVEDMRDERRRRSELRLHQELPDQIDRAVDLAFRAASAVAVSAASAAVYEPAKTA